MTITKTVTVLSLGAGVQSSVAALMLEMRDPRMGALYPKPDLAIFADTGWEPAYVYEHLDWLETQLSFPVLRVKAGDIKENILTGKTLSGQDYIEIPLFTKNGTSKGQLARHCTTKYKIEPIHKGIREWLGIKPRRRFPKTMHVDMLMGISTDEITRVKPDHEKWITKKYPLIDVDMNRRDCGEWFAERYPQRVLPRSACIGCPFRSDREWLSLRAQDEGAYQEAVEADAALRKPDGPATRLLKAGGVYLHKSRLPLDEALSKYANPLFGDEMIDDDCEGFCGV